MKRIKNYYKYLFQSIDESFINIFRIYRAIRGGKWFKHEMTGQLPGCYGSWWSRDKDHHPRYEAITKKEDYTV
jgi:hypothetical protein